MEALLVSIGVVALGEMGDNTQLLAPLLAARFKRPVPFVLGILAATLFNHTLAGWLAAWLAAELGPQVLRWVVGVGFLGMGLDSDPGRVRRCGGRRAIAVRCLRDDAADLFPGRDGRQDAACYDGACRPLRRLVLRHSGNDPGDDDCRRPRSLSGREDCQEGLHDFGARHRGHDLRRAGQLSILGVGRIWASSQSIPTRRWSTWAAGCRTTSNGLTTAACGLGTLAERVATASAVRAGSGGGARLVGNAGLA